MITFHTIVRGFAQSGRWRDTQTKAETNWDAIQRNAIGSWLQLKPKPEVLLYGLDEPGATEYAVEMGLPLYPLKRNERGVPLVRWPIEHAAEHAKHAIRCLANADIVLMDDFMHAVNVVEKRFDEFLLIAQRYGVPPAGLIDFDGDWRVKLLQRVKREGQIKHRGAVDYFVHRGDWLRDVPDFAVGRTSWDNWIVWKALDSGVPVVDGTLFTICIHQDHGKRRVSTETEENRALLKQDIGGFVVATLDHATWLLGPGGELMRTGAGAPRARG